MKKQISCLLFLPVFFFINISCAGNKKGNNAYLIDDCNHEIAVASPKRVICIGQQTVELMISLGLGEKVIGWCFPDSKKQPDIYLISQQYPSKEIIYSLRPDFIYSGFLGTFRDENLGTREALKESGIDSYVSSCRCLDGKKTIQYEDFFKDIYNIGKIFNVEKRAAKIVDSLEQEILHAKQQIAVSSTKLRVIIFSGIHSNGSFSVTGGEDISNSILNDAGAINVFEATKAQDFSVNPETIINANPEFIIVKESLTDPEAKLSISSLENNPLFSQLSAVKNKRYIVLSFNSLLPSLNNVTALKQLIYEFKKTYME